MCKIDKNYQNQKTEVINNTINTTMMDVKYFNVAPVEDTLDILDVVKTSPVKIVENTLQTENLKEEGLPESEAVE